MLIDKLRHGSIELSKKEILGNSHKGEVEINE